MVIILYSLGPGLCLKTLCPRDSFSLTGYLATVFLLEAEPWLRQAAEPVFLWSRTLLGALAAAMLIALTGRSFLGSVRRVGWKVIRPHERSGELPALKPAALIFGAVAGALVSLTFAALSGVALTPLWPLYDGAVPAEPFSEWRVRRLATRFLTLALIIWGFKRMRGYK